MAKNKVIVAAFRLDRMDFELMSIVLNNPKDDDIEEAIQRVVSTFRGQWEVGLGIKVYKKQD